MVRSYTTRPPRANELANPEKSDHYFVDKTTFDRIMAEETPVAYTKINGYEYCATKAEFAKSDVYVIDPEGFDRLKEWAGDRYNLLALYVSTSRENAMKRLGNRQESIEAQAARWTAEDEQFARFENGAEYDICLSNNGTFENGVKCMQTLLLAFIDGNSRDGACKR